METENGTTYGRHVVQVPSESSFCAGCRSCEVICALVHDGVSSPVRRRLYVRRNIRMMTHEIMTCQHCSDHPCYTACPKKDEAMVISDDGIVSIVESVCNGCGLCQRACPFQPSRITFVKGLPKERRKARKCDMCRDREAGPACVEWCPVRCLEVE